MNMPRSYVGGLGLEIINVTVGRDMHIYIGRTLL